MKTTEELIKLPARYYRNFPPCQPVGYIEDLIFLRVSQTAFLLIDVYGLGFDPDYQYGQVDEFYKSYVDICRDIIIHHIKPAKSAAKQKGFQIIYLSNYLAPSTTKNNEWRKMSMRTCGVDVLEDWKEPSDVLAYSNIIAPEEGEYQIMKQHYSGFYETHLDSLLCELEIKNLIIVGFDSLICLHSTALDALYRNYRIVVLRDCTITTEYQETESDGWTNWLAIRFIESNIGYTSMSDQFIKACG